jgi:hypothetical protein
MQALQILDPFDQSSTYGLFPTHAIAGTLPTLLVDLALLLRMLAVYPLHTMPKVQFIAIFTLPVLLKIARAGTFIAWIVHEGRNIIFQTTQSFSSYQRGMIVACNVMNVIDNA